MGANTVWSARTWLFMVALVSTILLGAGGLAWSHHSVTDPSDFGLKGQMDIVAEADDQQEASVAGNPNSGDFLVAWRDFNLAAPLVRTRIVHPDGVLEAPVLLTAVAGDGNWGPEVAYNGDADEFLVVYQDCSAGFTSCVITGQRMSSLGALVDLAFAVNAGGCEAFRPAVAYNTVAQAYLVVWTSRNSNVSCVAGPFTLSIAGHFLSSAGVPEPGSDVQISPAAGVDESTPTRVSASANDGRWLVTYNVSQPGGFLQIPFPSEVRGRVVAPTAAGITLTPEVHIFPGPGDLSSFTSDAAFDPTNNRWLVVSQTLDDGTKGLQTSQVQGRFVTATGALIGSAPFGISPNPVPSLVFVGINRGPRVAWHGQCPGPNKNTFLVVWQDGRDPGTLGTDVFGQLLKSNGHPHGKNFAVSSEPGSEQNPAVAMNQGTCRDLVVWEDTFQATDILDIRGRFLK